MSDNPVPEDKRIPIKPPKITGVAGRVIRAPRYSWKKAARPQPAAKAQKPRHPKKEEPPRPKEPFIAKETPVPLAPRIRDHASRHAPHSSRRKSKRILLSVLAVLVALALTYQTGVWRERARLTSRTRDAGSSGAEPAQLQALDSALRDLRLGESAAAAAAFATLQQGSPKFPSLQYISALAAMESGDFAAATAAADASVALGERVSDSLVIRAQAEIRRQGAAGETLGRTREKAEADLRKAIAADPANPAPYLALASLKRQEGRDHEAKELLDSARTRLPAVDQHVIVETELLLLRLARTPGHQLPADLDPDKDPASLIAAAYVAMRQGNTPRAVELLSLARRRLPRDLYGTLLADPVFREYSVSENLAPFFAR